MDGSILVLPGGGYSRLAPHEGEPVARGGMLASSSIRFRRGIRARLRDSWLPVVSMLAETHRGSRDQLLGPRPSHRLRRATSLERIVTPSAPPMFIWTTGEDASVVPADHSLAVAAALVRNGVPHDLHIVERGPHGAGLRRRTARRRLA